MKIEPEGNVRDARIKNCEVIVPTYGFVCFCKVNLFSDGYFNCKQIRVCGFQTYFNDSWVNLDRNIYETVRL